jgi:4-alpha-glucanotransferase
MTTVVAPIHRRSAGLLLHPTSLPGPFGIGDLGPIAFAFVDALAKAKQTWWQILPLGPTGFGDSPYQSYSAFAGNPLLISPDRLVEAQLLAPHDLHGGPFPEHYVDYDAVLAFKNRLLDQAWTNFQLRPVDALKDEFQAFVAAEASWLNDYALFMALKDALPGAWYEWSAELVRREPATLTAARSAHAERIGRHQFTQFLFFRQWQALRKYATSQGVGFIGDAPIFISPDSADVWANPELFLLDADFRPTAVAGVPPDYFSPTGQLWGNPLYDWAALKRTNYAWWVARLRATLAQVDLVRLDHFRGFAAAWHVPVGATTAETGAWVPGPGADLFETLKVQLGGLPIIAEDLGVITPDVETLREQFGLPGMLILQFAFGGDPHDRFLPHNHVRNAAVYTGTHDNDTLVGWLSSLHDRGYLRRYCARPDHELPADLLRQTLASIADYAIVPMQDLLFLGTDARMNFPGKAEGNWRWRLLGHQLTAERLYALAAMTELYGRVPPVPAPV